ncbi:kallikrein-14-like [Carettochelys insculpta]|uniref:kallikrein-14-like n=1 Tax=Carettochelys insculpta TaxID=44489 RepID=UPI003EBC0BAE
MKLLIIVMLVAGAGAASGEQGNRVVGGKSCLFSSRPYQAVLLRNGRNYCGGSLIHPKWVLTAAHCSRRIGSVQVHLGAYNLRVKEFTQQRREILNYFIHPRYSLRHHLDYDFMLLELDEPVQLNSNVNTIKLATRCPTPGRRCSVSGWGTTTSPIKTHPDILQCANLYITSQAKCLQTYPGKITKSMFCAGVERGGTSSCKGDSGGPLVCRGKLQGVVSWGKAHCAKPGQPRVFANVCKVTQWVKNTIRKRDSCLD